jgi:nitrite reductase/ring-hydroxylating ferredoxin subunit
MARESDWIDLGAAGDLKKSELQSISANGTRIALSFRDGEVGAVSNACNHVGGPLGDGQIDPAGYVTCPWHGYKYHCRTGLGEPGFEEDKVPSFPVKVEGGRVLVDLANPSKRGKPPHDEHPLAREVKREPGALRIAGISTTAMDKKAPRF